MSADQVASGRFAEHVALVNGGAAAMGAACVRRLVAEGATVAVVDDDATRAKELVAEVGEGGAGQLAWFVGGSPTESGITRMVAKVTARFGRLDHLVNASTTVTNDGLLDMSMEDWDRVHGVNLRRHALFMRACADALGQSRGSIVNIASIEAIACVVSGTASQSHYVSSKAGLVGLSRSAAFELSRWHVRVNVVHPGFIRSPYHATPEIYDTPPSKHPKMGRILLDRWGEPEDVAAAVAFLLSADASYITGTTLVVDGGWTVQ